jgi:hypothetical protein
MATPPGLVQSGRGTLRMSAKSLSDRLFDDDDRAQIDPFALFDEWFA